ncbi:MAG TPA: amidohydrolase family protein [Bacteroidia bacterium]|nr:amidohydrolase family protein [Bacteroidia bacterium]
MATYINVHTHIFSINHVPEYVVGQNRWLVPISVKRFGGINDWVLTPLMPVIGLFTKRKAAARLQTFARLGLATDQADQYQSLAEYYKGLGHDFRYVVLPMDMEQMGAGLTESNLYTQLLDIIEMRQNPEIAHRLIPFVPVDPRRPEFTDGTAILNFVKHYIEKFGFAGIKLYPALGYFPFDPKLTEMYKWAIEKQIPIMVHCIQGVIHWQGSMDNWRSILSVAEGLEGYQNDPSWQLLSEKDKTKKREIFQRNFTQPNNYDVLIKYLRKQGVPNAEKLKVCLGHFGMDDDKWFNDCKNLIANYENFYADISYVVSQDKCKAKLIDVMSSNQFKSKILFGTDFYVVSKEKKEDEILKVYLELIKEFSPFAEVNAENYLKNSIR